MSRIMYVCGKTLLPSDAIAKTVFTGKYAMNAGLCVDFLAAVNVTEKMLEHYDVIILSRPDNILAYGIASCAKSGGCFVVVMLDDDLLAAKGLVHEAKWRQNALKEIIKISDLLFVSSPRLKEKYAPFMLHERVFMGNTAVSQDEFVNLNKRFRHENRPVKIVYAAGGDHEVLFDQFIRPVMPKLAAEFGDRISLTFMGVSPGTEDLKKLMKVEHIPGMPLEEYRKKIQKGCYDIGLAPLTMDAFSGAKYFNKYLEYATAGIVGVYTETEPYTSVICDGYNGFLVRDNDEEVWYEKLCLAIKDRHLREECVRNAFHHITEHYDPETVFGRMLEQIPEFLFYNGNRQKIPSLCIYKLKYRLQRVMDLFFLIMINFRDGGIRQVYKKVRNHFPESRGAD